MSTTLNFTMTQDEVNKFAKLGQYTMIAQQVEGSQILSPWLTFKPSQHVAIQFTNSYQVYNTSTIAEDGATITATNNSPAFLGNAYTWDGSAFTQTGKSAFGTITITNNTSDTLTFGLAKIDPQTKEISTICADTLTNMQQVQYKPLNQIATQMGRMYKTNTVYANLGNLTFSEFSGDKVNFSFIDTESIWEMTA